MNKILKIFLLFTSITFWSCQDIFQSPPVDQQNQAVVVFGKISDEPGPYSVKISKTISFATEAYKRQPQYVTGATVTILDDAGNKEVLKDMQNGEYQTATNGIRGTSGRTYTLKVTMPDGTMYESIPSKLSGSPNIDSITAQPGNKQYLVKQPTGDYALKTDEGFFVYAYLSTAGNENVYYRFDAEYIKEIFHTERTQYRPLPVPVFCWSSGNSDETINTKEAENFNGKSSVRKQKIIFIPVSALPMLQSYSTPPTTIGWITNIYIQTISKDVYNYYNDLKTQLDAKQTLFDPVPNQVSGNIRCATDETVPVYGVFEVSSIVKKVVMFQWQLTQPIVKSKSLDTYPKTITPASCGYITQPDFWVEF